MLQLLIVTLTALVLTFVTGAEVAVSETADAAKSTDAVDGQDAVEADLVEAKSSSGYGYGNDYGYGGGFRGNGGSDRYGYGGYEKGSGHGYGGHRGYGQQHISPIQIPYIDKNGCRFPGDKVCDPTSATTMACNYNLCLLTNEGTNLWKKPSMSVLTQVCGTDIAVLSEFCNNNEKLLRAVGLIKDESHRTYKHQQKLITDITPCLKLDADTC